MKELNALIDPCAEYCVISKVDAYLLGYSEVANDDPIGAGKSTLTFSSYFGYAKAPTIEIAQLELGTMSFKKVDFVAFDLPQVAGFDVVLGRSFLKFTRFEIDYSTAQLRIEERRRPEG